MTQTQFILFFDILPILCGLILGLILLKFKKSYIWTGVMVGVCVIWGCILSGINTHGSEGPGLIFRLYVHVVIALSFVELIKYIVRKINKDSRKSGIR